MNLFSQLFGSSSIPSVDPVQAQARMGSQPQPLLLDVRQPEEYSAGHIPGAKLIPLHDLPARTKELPKDREIICVCRSGNRSHSATRHLTSAGFNAVNLAGGMNAWTHHGFPVKKGSAR